MPEMGVHDPEIGVHDGPKWVFTMLRNTHMRIPAIVITHSGHRDHFASLSERSDVDDLLERAHLLAPGGSAPLTPHLQSDTYERDGGQQAVPRRAAHFPVRRSYRLLSCSSNSSVPGAWTAGNNSLGEVVIPLYIKVVGTHSIIYSLQGCNYDRRG